nr:alpha-L-arabinofuranosidase C-terminal domain-containing protein [Paenibacillus bovis]
MKALVEVNVHKQKGRISPYIYGQYFEHLEDCIYPSVMDSWSQNSNEVGLRQDVIEAAKELSVPIIRWPGGCFADFYHWEDGIGPKEERPVRRNWHWGGLESNQFGTDEFLKWCEAVGADPYINFNLGTGTLDEALRWMDYCIGTEETTDVLRRKANGREAPYHVKHWGVGNETWGFWEAGQMDALTYSQKLRNWVEFIKKYQADSSILAVGSNGGLDPEWDAEVLKQAGTFIDYLTIHNYGFSVDRESGDEYYSVVFSPTYFKKQIEQMISTIEDYEKTLSSDHYVKISMDEWNIRHFIEDENGRYHLNRKSPRNIQDAIFAAGILNTMIQLSPRVGMANYVFLVNGNGVMNVNEEGVVKTPLYYVFQQYGRWMNGVSLETSIDSPTRIAPTPQLIDPYYKREYTEEVVSYIDTAASLNDDGSIVISIINRHQDEEIDIELVIPNGLQPTEIWTLNHHDIYAANDFDNPENILPTIEKIEEKITSWKCPAHSLVLIKCEQE